MARPTRLDYPESFYHVLSRGNERRDIFYEKRDYIRFLELMGKMVKRFKVDIHAYVLMKNHYHLLIRTKDANLSQAVQWLGVSYAVWFNRKHLRSGHLFQGRFKSFLIEDERYFTALCLYIHGNPVRAQIVKRVKDYRWSSYRGYANKDYQASWLTTDVVLGTYGGNRKRFIRAQHSFLGEENTLLDDLRHGLYLGSDEFAEECIRRAKREESREKPQVRSLLKDRKIQPLALKILTGLGEEDPDSVMSSRRRTRRPSRDITIYILSCLGVYTNKRIGEAFGVGYTAVSGAAKRGERYVEENERLKEIVEKIINDI